MDFPLKKADLHIPGLRQTQRSPSLNQLYPDRHGATAILREALVGLEMQASGITIQRAVEGRSAYCSDPEGRTHARAYSRISAAGP